MNAKEKAVPITSDILERLGFAKSGNFYEIQHESKIGLEISQCTGGWEVSIEYWGGVDYVTIPKVYKYIHQIQNIYFALTEEELTLK